jgi:hypothetical protein
MPHLIYTSTFSAVLALMLVSLSGIVIARRIQTQTANGDGDDERLRQCIRAHGNFAEYVPLGLVLMLVIELQGGPPYLLLAVGLLLVLGRTAHAIGLIRQIMPARQLGMLMTFSALLIGAARLLWQVMA